MSNILSRKTRPLLRTVGGYPRAEYDKSTADDIKDSPAEASLKPGKKQSVHRIKKNVDPISDDKPSDTGFRRLSPEIEDSDGSGGGRPDRGSIKSTNFVSSKEASNGRQQSGQGKPPKETTWAQNSNGSKRRKLVDDAEAADRKTTTPSSSQRSSSSKSGKTPTSSGEHMTTAMGFVKKPKVVQAYGAGSKGSAKRTSGSQEKRLTVFQSKNGAGDTNNLVNGSNNPPNREVQS